MRTYKSLLGLQMTTQKESLKFGTKGTSASGEARAFGSWSLLIHNYNPANTGREMGHSPAVGEFISSKEEEYL